MPFYDSGIFSKLHNFWNVNSGISIKEVTNTFFRGKQTSKINNFWCYYSKTKTEDWDQKNLCFSVDFGMLMSWATSDFLKVRARFSLKVATKGSARSKNTENLDFYVVFPKQKRRSATKKFEMFLINLASLSLVQLHIFWT